MVAVSRRLGLLSLSCLVSLVAPALAPAPAPAPAPESAPAPAWVDPAQAQSQEYRPALGSVSGSGEGSSDIGTPIVEDTKAKYKGAPASFGHPYWQYNNPERPPGWMITTWSLPPSLPAIPPPATPRMPPPPMPQPQQLKESNPAQLMGFDSETTMPVSPGRDPFVPGGTPTMAAFPLQTRPTLPDQAFGAQDGSQRPQLGPAGMRGFAVTRPGSLPDSGTLQGNAFGQNPLMMA